jgi:hypothetical protein
MTSILIVCFTFFFCACEHGSMFKQQKAEDFKTFYSRFNRNLEFQNSRMRYPIKGKNYTDSNKNPTYDYEWTLKDHLDFDNHKLDTSIYSIRRVVFKDSVEERLYIKNSSFFSDYKFKLIHDKWFMTYYSQSAED